MTAGPSRTWSGFPGDWDRLLRAGRYPRSWRSSARGARRRLVSPRAACGDPLPRALRSLRGSAAPASETAAAVEPAAALGLCATGQALAQLSGATLSASDCRHARRGQAGETSSSTCPRGPVRHSVLPGRTGLTEDRAPAEPHRSCGALAWPGAATLRLLRELPPRRHRVRVPGSRRPADDRFRLSWVSQGWSFLVSYFWSRIGGLETVTQSSRTEIRRRSCATEPRSDPVTDQQINQSRQTVIEENTKAFGVHGENVL